MPPVRPRVRVPFPDRPPVRAAVLGLTAVLGGTLSACSADRIPGVSAKTGPPPSKKAEPRTHPLTGGTKGLDNPALAVKIENTRPAMPQSGVSAADLVYVEQVEGGETRLMAVFSSKLPRRVGPVRSARISDLHLLPQFGAPAFAFSGVQSKMKKYVRDAPVHEVSQESAGGAYFRAGPKYPPYNLYADPRDLLKKAPRAKPPRDIGLDFGAAPAGGTARKSFTARWPSASMGFTWSAKQKRWLSTFGGAVNRSAEGAVLGGHNVIIQYAKTTRSRFHDFLGSYTPLIHTTGTGRAVVLRDGRAYETRWSRASDTKGTKFTTADGKPMTLSRGQTWIVLVNDGKPYIP